MELGISSKFPAAMTPKQILRLEQLNTLTCKVILALITAINALKLRLIGSKINSNYSAFN